jgi:hypothetical protein
MLLISEEIDGQWQATPGQHAHQALLAQRTHQTIERHRGEVIEHGTQLQTEAAVGGSEGVPGDLRAH